MKSSTERDLLRLKSDLGASTRAMQGACLNLNANLKSTDSQDKVINQLEKNSQTIKNLILSKKSKNLRK